MSWFVSVFAMTFVSAMPSVSMRCEIVSFACWTAGRAELLEVILAHGERDGVSAGALDAEIAEAGVPEPIAVKTIRHGAGEADAGAEAVAERLDRHEVGHLGQLLPGGGIRVGVTVDVQEHAELTHELLTERVTAVSDVLLDLHLVLKPHAAADIQPKADMPADAVLQPLGACGLDRLTLFGLRGAQGIEARPEHAEGEQHRGDHGRQPYVPTSIHDFLVGGYRRRG